MIGSLGRAIKVLYSEAENDEGELYTAMSEKWDPLGKLILRVIRLPLPRKVWVMGLTMRLAHFQE